MQYELTNSQVKLLEAICVRHLTEIQQLLKNQEEIKGILGVLNNNTGPTEYAPTNINQ